MQKIGTELRCSASDLAGHLKCRHLTALDLAVARGNSDKLKVWDPLLQALFDRGYEYERQFVDHLKASGLDVVEIAGKGVSQSSADETLAAMKVGASVIVQGAFLSKDWGGRTDVLRRVERAGTLAPWSYEVIDTKLSRRTKGATVLQLCLYSELLSEAQGCEPEFMHVVAPWSEFLPQSFRTQAYAAYYRRARRQFAKFLQGSGDLGTYPEPNEHCDTCAWRTPCDARRRADDHLCLVANISKLQRAELHRRSVDTGAALAAVPLPLPWKPERGSAHSYERIREQARIQLEGRAAGKVLCEVLPLAKDLGLARLPAPSEGDIFFDLEGDPFAGEGGMEYLFGYVSRKDGSETYSEHWTLSREQEKEAFERFVDFALARLERYPDLHIYHYASYEPAALKRLMGRYATREEELDRLLRGRVFVDLYQIVRHGIRASVESYSIKQLEPLFGYERVTGLVDAGQALSAVQRFLETGDLSAISKELKATVAGYNRDDCVAARALRDWLEGIRAKLVDVGHVIERPSAQDSEPSEDVSAWQAKIERLVGRLTKDIPVDPAARTPEQHAQWILAYVLDWHRREIKSVWWEYFRLKDLTPEDLMDERAALSGLEFDSAVGGTARAPIHRYRFPPQETTFRGEEEPLHQLGGYKFGSVVAISIDERTVDIKKRQDTIGVHPEAVFTHKVIGTKEQAEALVRIGNHVALNGLEGDGNYPAARELLLRQRPSLGGEPFRRPGESILDAATRIAPHFKGVLPIQGPPGTGKTYVGARMICALVKSGAKVGITAHSHAVIRRLLGEVVDAAERSGMTLKCVQKSDDVQAAHSFITYAGKNDEVYRALATGKCQVAAGTSWLWAPAAAHQALDVLFVDEAAQMSLANVLAVSHAADKLILLGDPQQLDQPTRGSHPDGTGVSALHHLLSGRPTINEDQGLFLADTWRLHPRICAFTSEMFYEGKLQSVAGVDRQEIRSDGPLSGTGLYYLPVVHEGNKNSSLEEAEAVRAVVASILNANTTWVNREGKAQSVGLKDILVIAPYNAQVFELQAKLPGARVGTVDRFQGQEAPIVICSMTTSSYADAPRGMEFLYNLNRLNVATSRAQCLSILVASPALFDPECRTPEQMRMANAFCRYLELAKLVPI
jgi:predicted RecB family nuclease